ncbi:conserved hypothetical protein [Neospora caninum Liverpool]|uniref:Uncharacterized protein n=1 Tax=Neospora caninum (strain Liverpool) TaxID=572307 RepID=F0V872_NEOCL|nr:conserved hypothetical protein [Neospora caninum Liverpool]CBZ49913.1 conserved hypothetical protein [Neospora caninum Liverpool]|eukprot:XP_003879948.1 conserved hypothetical protein [Neospora caninum Liverpool]
MVDKFLWTPTSVIRLVIEATCMLLLLATAISNLSGYSWWQYSPFHVGLPDGYQSSAQQAGASAGSPLDGLTLNADVLLEEMHKAKLHISACYDEKRTSQGDFLVCLGRMECDVAGPASNMILKPARHSVMRRVVTHFSKQLATSDLSKIFSEAGRIGLACDTLHI